MRQTPRMEVPDELVAVRDTRWDGTRVRLVAGDITP